MESEFLNIMKVWLSATISLCYCYLIGKTIPKGTTRLAFLIPVLCLFLYLPLNISSVHLTGITGFFIAWLANFKLLLFAFGSGPLSSSISLPLFITVSCLPINIQKNRKQQQQSHQSMISYAIKFLLLAVLVRVYDYSENLNPMLILFLYSLHIYFILELILAISAAMARTILGLELEPQFNEPFLSTSLQDFWGKRWNLMVTGILRPTVYKPTVKFFSNAIGRKWAPLPAVFCTFLASAVMHELVFFYLGRVKPSWDITLFFLIHGFCLTVEIAVKKAVNDRWRLPTVVSGLLTVGFVMSTGLWLFFPEFTRTGVDVKAFEEYAALGAFAKNLSRHSTRLVGR